MQIQQMLFYHCRGRRLRGSGRGLRRLVKPTMPSQFSKIVTDSSLPPAAVAAKVAQLSGAELETGMKTASDDVNAAARSLAGAQTALQV